MSTPTTQTLVEASGSPIPDIVYNLPPGQTIGISILIFIMVVMIIMCMFNKKRTSKFEEEETKKEMTDKILLLEMELEDKEKELTEMQHRMIVALGIFSRKVRLI